MSRGLRIQDAPLEQGEGGLDPIGCNVSAKHLPGRLEEMTFRFNRRGRADLFLDALRHMVTAVPLTFQASTAPEIQTT